MTLSHIDIAQSIREKFDFYLVGLSFTLLGLSVQTATFGSLIVADIFELTGWAFLFVSGLSGLSRMEWSSHAHKAYSMRDDNQERLRTLQRGIIERADFVASDTGETLSPQGEIQLAHNNIKTIDEALKGINRSLIKRYWIQRIGLIAGIVLVLISRATNGLAVWM
jgi:hypothetical protein